MSKTVVIIGGGIAGLTTAFLLKKAGLDVTLFESSLRVGGVMFSTEEDGYLAETGPNTILETSPKVSEIVRNLGLDGEKVYANDTAKTRFIVKNQQPVPLPLSPLSFFRTNLFSRVAKLRIFKEPFIEAWDNQYEESLSQFVVRRLGQEFLDYAINPFVAGVYGGEPDHLSVRHALPKLYQLEQKYGSLIKGQIFGAKERKKHGETPKQRTRMFSFLHGLKTLPEAFQKALGDSIQKDTTVNDVTPMKVGWRVSYKKGDNTTKTATIDSIVYAGTAFGLKEMTLSKQSKDDFVFFQKIYHPPVSVLVLGFKRDDVDHPLNGFGMLIPKVEGFHTLGALFSSTLFPNRAPRDHVTLTIFIGGSRQPENALKSEPELIDMALADMSTLLGVRSKPTFVKHTFWEQAIPQYDVGFGTFKEKLNDLEKQYPGLYFAGNYRNGISVADTIVNAYETSERIINSYI
ncbi:MAG: protoporphyrinogen oxidase [Candidatus Marinimicrobia bacterium]|nr:protoporphyrinogen oxidase [Candidatus Neomarinimicrobiota bacterium]